MNGTLDSTTGPATAEKAMTKTQSGSPANRNTHDIFGIFFGQRGRRQSCSWQNTIPAAKRKNYFSEIACHFGETG
jgi:hypothetical protein